MSVLGRKARLVVMICGAKRPGAVTRRFYISAVYHVKILFSIKLITDAQNFLNLMNAKTLSGAFTGGD